MRSSIILVLGLLVACGSTASTAPPPQSAEEPEDAINTREQMWHHFWDASDARQGVINGDLEAVKAALGRLGAAKLSPEIDESWGEWVEEMQTVATQGAAAGTLEQAASAIAAVGSTCAECHRATGGGPTFGEERPAYEHRGLKGLAERMARHVYSEEELWLGMSGPVHPAWSRGSAALMNIEVPKLVTHKGEAVNEDLPPTGGGDLTGEKAPETAPAAADGAAEPKPEAGAAAGGGANGSKVDLDIALRDLRELGKRADTTSIPKEKQAVYADVLSSCGSCHAKLGIKPGIIN